MVLVEDPLDHGLLLMRRMQVVVHRILSVLAVVLNERDGGELADFELDGGGDLIVLLIYHVAGVVSICHSFWDRFQLGNALHARSRADGGCRVRDM